jgi:hypothetical protein
LGEHCHYIAHLYSIYLTITLFDWCCVLYVCYSLSESLLSGYASAIHGKDEHRMASATLPLQLLTNHVMAKLRHICHEHGHSIIPRVTTVAVCPPHYTDQQRVNIRNLFAGKSSATSTTSSAASTGTTTGGTATGTGTIGAPAIMINEYNHQRTLNEPTAACGAYGLDRYGGGIMFMIYVIHIGLNHINITSLLVDEGIYELIAQDTHYGTGGDTITTQLINRVLASSAVGIDIATRCRASARATQRLYQQCDAAKHYLSDVAHEHESYRISIPLPAATTAATATASVIEYNVTRDDINVVVASCGILATLQQMITTCIKGSRLGISQVTNNEPPRVSDIIYA